MQTTSGRRTDSAFGESQTAGPPDNNAKQGNIDILRFCKMGMLLEVVFSEPPPPRGTGAPVC